MPRRAKASVNDFVRDRIRRLRRSKNLSTRQLAALSGIPEGSYCCLEGGLRRINLYNLQKIMQALGGTVHDVWPRSQEAFEETPPRSSGQASVNFLRFREICSLTEAHSAALLNRSGGSLQLIFESNMAGAEKVKLLEALAQERSPGEGWLVYEKSARGKAICLALHNAEVEGRLGVLLDLYLDLWLAVQTAKEARGVRNRRASGVRRSRRPKAGGI